MLCGLGVEGKMRNTQRTDHGGTVENLRKIVPRQRIARHGNNPWQQNRQKRVEAGNVDAHAKTQQKNTLDGCGNRAWQQNHLKLCRYRALWQDDNAADVLWRCCSRAGEVAGQGAKQQAMLGGRQKRGLV
jgi:hypothetical protein